RHTARGARVGRAAPGPPPQADVPLADAGPDLPAARPPATRPGSLSEELPLFGARPDDAPLITRASPPRAPLSVRRATPEVPRLRTEQTPGILDFGLELPDSLVEFTDSGSPAARATVGILPDERPGPAHDAP